MEQTLELGFPGNIDQVIKSVSAGPRRTELLALAPAAAEQFRSCVEHQLQPFVEGDLLRTHSISRLASAIR